METQVQSFLRTPMGVKFITVFGYASKGVPGLEINGLGKFGKNVKEKIIYISRIRKIKTPIRRFVISVDVNDIEPNTGSNQLKWLEFPVLMAYWHLVGALKASTLEDCICAGEIKVSGEVTHLSPPENFSSKLPPALSGLAQDLKIIQEDPVEGMWHMDSKLFLEHIPGLEFRTYSPYIERVSETPIKSAIA